jgi:superfamily II DNA or RNA helicase
MPRHPHTKRFLKLFANLPSFAALERRIAALPNPKEKGDAMEVLAAAYFATQPVEKAKHVWPSNTVPASVIKRLALHSKDVGADGIIETVSGTYRAYQVKYRADRKPLTWTETSTFFGLTDRCDERLLFTNSRDVSEISHQRKDFSSIRGADLDRLSPPDFMAIHAWMKGKKVIREKRKPLPHQREALAKIIPAFRTIPRATVISACGTGKTYLALWAAEAVAHRTVLVLVPSLALLRQTLKDWVDQTSWKSYDYLCVCSDLTVSRGDDEMVVRPTELEFSVSTTPTEVRQFLRLPFKGIKIIFSTYQSAEVVAQGMGRGDAFDFGIFDEAHKTAGREGAKFSFALSDKNLPIRKRLFLTATPRHYDLGRRDREGEPIEVYSMDRPDIYGPVIHTLSFAEAARRGIICRYKVVISVVTSDMLTQRPRRHGTVVIGGAEVKAPHVANQVALAHAARKHRLKKIFSFHRNIAAAASFTSAGGEGIGTHLPDFGAFHVSGAMSTAERDGWLKEFKAADRAIMSNARCLTEGVDVPTVDMVAFMTPKRSKVDIVQAIGRAMRNAKGKTHGYILVPIYIEQARGESLEAAVARAEFDEVWAVLQAMQEQDEVLDHIIHELRAQRKLTKGFNDSRLRERIEILGPTLKLDDLRRSITTLCLDRLARPWDEMVQMLLAYKQKQGHLRVPVDAPAPWTELGLWVEKVRAWKRRGMLSSLRQDLLDDLGFVWRIDGQTLDTTEGLLNASQFMREAGFSHLDEYRKQGLIKPIGFAPTNASRISAFYHPKQIAQLRKALGITLNHTEGLINELDFKKASGFSRMDTYRKRGLIKPVGYAMTGPGVNAFYHPSQIAKLRSALGITLENTNGLLNERAFATAASLSRVADYRKEGLIKPVGYGLTNAGVSPFYHPRQVAELRQVLGISLTSTRGLLSEKQFVKRFGTARIEQYRKRGLIKPAGYGMSNAGVSPFYHPRQVAELRQVLGISLTSTRGLLNENQFAKVSGFTQIVKYRNNGLIKPLGKAFARTHLSNFYHPRQIAELKKTLGITQTNLKGLLNEYQFAKASKLSRVAEYRQQGLIKPMGWGMTNAGKSAFYHPRQIAQLKRRLGITLNDTKGLLNEGEFLRATGLSNIQQYRTRGIVTPVGRAFSSTSLSYFYRPRQVHELRKKLGITLNSTKGLISEREFGDLSMLPQIAKYRKQGLITPAGFGMRNSGVCPFYHPRQIAALKKTLAKLKKPSNSR